MQTVKSLLSLTELGYILVTQCEMNEVCTILAEQLSLMPESCRCTSALRRASLPSFSCPENTEPSRQLATLSLALHVIQVALLCPPSLVPFLR